jgi:hypothetical protein
MMEKTKDLTNFEGKNHDDQGLSEELESLYRRVARLDRPDSPEEKVDDPGDDKNFTDLRRQHTAPYLNPPNREELMERLMAIQDAYERLLTYWPFAPEHPLRSALSEASPQISMRDAPPDGK